MVLISLEVDTHYTPVPDYAIMKDVIPYVFFRRL